MALDVAYFALVFCVCIGVVQLVAGYSRLIGLLIVPHVPAAYALGLSLPVAAFAWFGASGRALVPGDIGGVEGAQQFGLFFAGAAAATIVTAIAASIIQWRRPAAAGEPEPGMEGLRHATAYQLLRHRFFKPCPVPAGPAEAPRP